MLDSKACILCLVELITLIFQLTFRVFKAWLLCLCMPSLLWLFLMFTQTRLRFGLLSLWSDTIHPIKLAYRHAYLSVDAQSVDKLDLALGGWTACLTLLVHDLGQLPGEEVAGPPIGIFVPNCRIRHNLTLSISVSRCRFVIVIPDYLRCVCWVTDRRWRFSAIVNSWHVNYDLLIILILISWLLRFRLSVYQNLALN